MKTPILETDRLILRPFNAADAQDVFECWESDADVAKYMFWSSHNDIKKTKAWISFELEQINNEVTCWEIGYNLGKKYWGKGYATEAMKEIIRFATQELRLREIVGRFAKENPNSGNVMQKLGFKYEKDIDYECNNGTVHCKGMQYRLYI